jgi:hypothetical protein
LQKNTYISRNTDALAEDAARKFDSLIETDETSISPFQTLKQPSGRSSPLSILKIIERLEIKQSTGVLDIDISWLNNNFQRALARYAKQCRATRLDNIKQAAILYSNSRYRHHNENRRWVSRPLHIWIQPAIVHNPKTNLILIILVRKRLQHRAAIFACAGSQLIIPTLTWR